MKIIKIYFNITSLVLILFTLITIIIDKFENHVEPQFSTPVSILIVFIFKFCFVNMFLLFITGIIFLIGKKNKKNAIFYLMSALFFLIFFMGFSNWDRF